MRLDDLLKTPLFLQTRVIAGEKGLFRKIQSVNMMDAPDIIDYLKPNELLLTTAYALRDDLDALHNLVRNMAKQECAGLAIKTKRFLHEVPRSVLDIADTLQFPIIELPLEYGLGELIYETLQLIQEHHAEKLSYALDAHRRFSNLILKGKGLQEIVSSLYDLIEKPLLLMDAQFQRIAHSLHNQSAIASALPEKIREIAPHMRLSLSSPGYFCLPQENGWMQAEMLLFPIEISRHQGYLAVLSSWIEPSSQTMLAIEQALNVIAIETIKLQELKKKSRMYKVSFFSDFLDGYITTETEIINRGAKYGISTGGTYFVLLGKFDPSPRLSENAESTERIYYMMKAELASVQWPFVLYVKDQMFHIIVTATATLPIVESMLLDTLGLIQRRIREECQISVSFSISSRANHLMDIPRAYKDALETLQANYSAKHKFFIQPYRAKQLIDLLRLIPKQDLSDFFMQSLQGIFAVKGKERDDLLETLATYLECHCNIADTAKQLYLHRNTVIYRLDKCEQLIGCRLKDADVSLRLRISLLMRSYLTS